MEDRHCPTDLLQVRVQLADHNRSTDRNVIYDAALKLPSQNERMKI